MQTTFCRGMKKPTFSTRRYRSPSESMTPGQLMGNHPPHLSYTSINSPRSPHSHASDIRILYSSSTTRCYNILSLPKSTMPKHSLSLVLVLGHDSVSWTMHLRRA
jgi:hypothetical protein